MGSEERSGARAGNLTGGTLKSSADQKNTWDVKKISEKEKRKELYNQCRDCHVKWLMTPRGQLTCYFPVSYVIQRPSGSVQVTYGRTDGQGGDSFLVCRWQVVLPERERRFFMRRRQAVEE
jgi:hypothetical protein